MDISIYFPKILQWLIVSSDRAITNGWGGKMNIQYGFAFVLALGLSAVASMTTVRAAEEITVQALATYQSYGRLFLVAEDRVLFVGGFNGIMFAETGDGSLNTAKIVCPGMMEINLDDERTLGEGHCIITDLKNNRIFAKWRCSGEALVGCEGTFDLRAGTGPWKGVSGGGDFKLRTAIAKFARNMSEDHAEGIGLGLATWPNLKIRLP